MAMTKEVFVNAIKSALYIFGLTLIAGLLPHGANISQSDLVEHSIQALYASILQFGLVSGLAAKANREAQQEEVSTKDKNCEKSSSSKVVSAYDTIIRPFAKYLS